VASDFTLVCVGQRESDEFTPCIQSLIDSGVFSQQICIPTVPDNADQYWCHVLASLPERVGKALVVSVAADVTLDLLRVGAQLGEGVVAALPLSVRHEIARPLMEADQALSLSAQDLNDWLNRYAVGKSVEVPVLAGYCAWIDAPLSEAAVAINGYDNINRVSSHDFSGAKRYSLFSVINRLTDRKRLKQGFVRTLVIV
jgi:hypothetical protein